MTTESGFEICFSFGAVVPPLKLIDETELAVETKVLQENEPGLDYLLKIFDKTTSDCKITINFIADDNQNNEIRSKMIGLLSDNEIDKKTEIGTELAKRLSKMTDERNKYGLFIILIGKKAQTYRAVLIRFKGEEVVYKKQMTDGFVIEILKEAYSKNSKHYKVVYFEDQVAERGNFWTGYVLDRQKQGKKNLEVSEYWIKDFLLCEYAMTDIQGTRKLAEEIKQFGSKLENVEDKIALVEAVVNLRNNPEQEFSILQFADEFLPANIRYQFKEFVGDDEISNTVFNVEEETFKHELVFKTIKLDNQISLSIPTFMGNEFFEERLLNDGRKEFTVTGRVINLKFTK